MQKLIINKYLSNDEFSITEKDTNINYEISKENLLYRLLNNINIFYILNISNNQFIELNNINYKSLLFI